MYNSEPVSFSLHHIIININDIIKMNTWRDAVREMMSLGCPKDDKKYLLDVVLKLFYIQIYTNNIGPQ